MQQATSALAYAQVKEPRVFVDPDHKWISIGTETLSLNRLRAGMQSLVQEVKQCYCMLSGSSSWPMPDDLTIKDNLRKSTRGYCFLEELPFRETQHSFFLSAVECHKLATLGSDGNLSWDMVSVRKFLCSADLMWGHLIHALYIGLQLSTRVTQFLQHQIQNADRAQNIFFQGSECLFIGRYSKTTNMKSKDGCVLAFLATLLRDLLFVLLSSGLREAQVLLAGLEYGKEACWLYCM